MFVHCCIAAHGISINAGTGENLGGAAGVPDHGRGTETSTMKLDCLEFRKSQLACYFI
jgi:hypothetical protein